jgi:hypothetical protein
VEFPTRSLPSLHAFERGPLVRPIGIVLAQDRERLDSRQNRERCDLTAAADRPYRFEAEEASRETSLEALTGDAAPAR